MAPEEDRIRVTARISKDLDTRIHRFYNNMAPAIIEGLELLAATKEGALSPNGTTEDTIKDTEDKLVQLGDKVGELERQLGDKDKIIGDKEKQLGDKDKEIEFLRSQITIKDQQLDKQAFSLQAVIQENSRLNLKLLPESTEVREIKKPWWKFW